jgi:hypothetical protein
LILKAETAHSEIKETYTAFIGTVKSECVMEGHYFAFPTIAELIVRKNFTRKQYETLIKLLVSVKNAYLE